MKPSNAAGPGLFSLHALFTSFLLLFASACAGGGGDLQATSEAMRAQASEVPFIPTATSIAEDTPTLEPTVTETPVPTATLPAPTETATEVPLPTATPTPLPTQPLVVEVSLPTPEWVRIYFTDPARASASPEEGSEVLEALIRLIVDAEDSIRIAAAQFNLSPVAKELIAAHERGVEVQWITDDELGLLADKQPEGGQFALLQDAGIEVRDDQRVGEMSNTFWVFDGRFVWAGSTNPTRAALRLENNNAMLIDSPRLASSFEREFNELWEGEFGVESPSTAGLQSTNVEGTPVQVLFAAEDSVGQALVEVLLNAENSIRFMAARFTHDEMGATVITQAAAGLDVAGIFERLGSQTELSELPVMYCAGLDVRQDGNADRLNHKVLVLDERIVVTGSFDFTGNADQSSDAHVLIIDNAEIAALYLLEFERRWAEAAEPNPADFICEQG